MDTNLANAKHDSITSNVMYEGVVGATDDVSILCHTQSHIDTRGTSAQSGTQAFRFVNGYILKISEISPDIDPVTQIPALQELTAKFANLAFFITATFGTKLGVVWIAVWVRTLPIGVDNGFDTNLADYWMDTPPYTKRRRKLELFVNLGPGNGLSILAWTALKTMNTILKFTRRGEPEIPSSSNNGPGANLYERTAFPGMTLNNYLETKHYGGGDTCNHVSLVTMLDANLVKHWAAKLVFQRLEDGAIEDCVLDWSYVLEGLTLEELPERALCTIRSVHLDLAGVALDPPPDHLNPLQQNKNKHNCNGNSCNGADGDIDCVYQDDGGGCVELSMPNTCTASSDSSKPWNGHGAVTNGGSSSLSSSSKLWSCWPGW
uniref:Uncharacterized protein n=1 Tax=Leptocylindrus danicus TaxID=163516 RepID=A0A7S2JV54_9STRA